MKKLLFWAALLTTGFAFYSCDDVVDNPAQDPASVWNYSVSVQFAEFTGVTYEAPKTLYVFNEENKLMGTIATDVAPAAGATATYAGTLTGTIANNLIITTANENTFAKQDGTLESAVKYGIIQTDTVPIKIYNANSQKITTGAANLKNKVGILEFKYTGSAINDDRKITFSTENLDIPGLTEKTLTITLDDAVNPKSESFYVALGKDTDDAIDLQFEVDGLDRGLILNGKKEEFDWDNGKVNAQTTLNMKIASADLTKYWATYKENSPTAKYFYFYPNDGTIITQSSNEKVPARILVYNKEEITLKNVNAEYLLSGWFADTLKVNLEGKNIFESEENNTIQNSNTIIFFTGTGSLEASGKKYGIQLNSGSWTDSENNTKYTSLVIDKGATVTAKASNCRGIYLSGSGLLEVRDDATFTASGPDGGIELGYGATLNIGKATIEAIGTGDNSTGIQTQKGNITIGEGATITAKAGKNGEGINSGADWDVKKGATIKAYGGKDGKGIDIWTWDTNEFKTGENVTIEAYGAPSISDDALGQGMRVGVNMTLGKGTTIKATGADRYGLWIYGTTTIDIAEGATIEAIDALANALEIESGANVTIKGKGALKAEDTGKYGINNAATLNLNGAVITAKGAAGKPAIQNNGTLTIGSDVISVTATAGTGSTVCIADADGAEAKKADIGTADDKKFNDAVKDGVRTITPIAAAE